jgi:hypothetical protein
MEALLTREEHLDDRAMWNIPSQARMANSPVVPRSIKQRGWSRCVGALRAIITAENGHEDRIMPHLQNAPQSPIHDRRIRTLLFLVWGHRDRWVTPLHTCTQDPRRRANGRLPVVRSGHTILDRRPAFVIAAMRQPWSELLQMSSGRMPPIGGPALLDGRAVCTSSLAHSHTGGGSSCPRWATRSR